MAYLFISNCVNKYHTDIPHNVSLINSKEKYALVADIICVLVLTTLLALTALSVNGVNLGQMSGIGSLGMTAVYILGGCAGGIVIADLINFFVQRAKYLSLLKKINQQQQDSVLPAQDSGKVIQEEKPEIQIEQINIDTETKETLNDLNDTETQQLSELQKYSRVKNQPIPLTEVVKGKDKGELAEKLSVHWLKDAATRVFHDPLRSFLELVVNALDASLPPEKGVGKFGIGFLSILSFLDHAETEGCTIQIETVSRNDEESFVSLSIDIFKEQNSYQVIFKDGEEQQQTGTTITVKPKKGKFSEQTLESLSLYCHALQFYEHGKIEISSEGKTDSIGEGSETLAWVTLDKGQLVVRDKGCGISEDIAYTKLFIPSTSTKSSTKERSENIRLPELKVYGGKRDAVSHFVIAINGVVVIDVPFKSDTNQDILLRMPASTRLTLARDAIETRSETVQYFKRVIDAAVERSVTSIEDALLLLAFCKGLKTWEMLTPSIAEVQLSAHLHLAVQRLFQEQDLIPYPLEQAEALRPLLPQNSKLIPFPGELLFNNFAAFEMLLETHYRDQKRDNLIAGKYVLFTDCDKVTSHGLRNWIFAPKTLSNLPKKSLQLNLVTRFADDGRTIECAPKKHVFLVPHSMARMNSPKGYLFITGRDTIPRLMRWKWAKASYFSFVPTASKKDLNDLLQVRNKEYTSPFIHLTQLSNIFEKEDNCPFLEMWYRHSESIIQYFSHRLVDSICESKSNFCSTLSCSVVDDVQKLQMIEKVHSCIIFEADDSNQLALFTLKNPKETLKDITDKTAHYTGREAEYAITAWLKESAINQYLIPLAPEEGCKLLFAWLFAQMGVLEEGVQIFTHEKVIWPPEAITVEYLEYCFELFLKNPIQAFKDCTQYDWEIGTDPRERINEDSSAIKQLPPSTIIASRTLATFQQQQAIWKILEEYMDYQPYGPLAIKYILPLLLLKDKMSLLELPLNLHKKFDLFVQQMLAHYHRFLEIKTGDVKSNYGSELYIVPVVDTTGFDACSIGEIADLLASLKDKPQLFEKCLDLYVQEAGKRMDTKKRNERLARNEPLYVENIRCNNGIALLSIAKSCGVDPMLIETVLQHVNSPFELYMMGLVFVGQYYERYFVKPADKKATALILTEAITIYLRKSKPYSAIRTYNNEYPEFQTLSGTFSRSFSNLLWPFYNYFYEIKSSKRGKQGGAFTIVMQAIPDSIETKLKETRWFTSNQVIHAARNANDYASILQTGDLGRAVEIITEQPEESDLQMITQAVEHGSERSGMAATLIEAFQNSVDAIRSFLKNHPDASKEKTVICFDVRIMEDTEPKLFLEVSDSIGMQSLKTLLADFLIPNFSEKGQDSVGEMGNGSYQMYREAECVTIKTRTLEDSARVYFLKIEPIRHPETHEVIDLKNTCVDITDLEPEFVGTTLNVVMRGISSKTAVIFEAILARNFIKETFSLANPPLGEKHTLECKLQFPKEKLLLDGIDRRQTFQIPGSHFCCYKMRQEQDLGYVLTDGYPFKLLEIFLVEEEILPPELAAEVARGWCLNLPKGSYSPVQSRTRVHLTPEAKNELKVFLLDWLYFCGCYKKSSGPLQRYYPHLESRCSDFNQVYPISRRRLSLENVLKKGDPVSLEAFFVHYKPSFLQKSFKDAIKEGYAALVEPLQQKKQALLQAFKTQLTPANRDKVYTKLVSAYEAECKEIKTKWLEGLNSQSNYEKLFLENVVIPWFTNKTDMFFQSIPSLQALIATSQQIRTIKEAETRKIQHDKVNLDKAQVEQWITSATQILEPYCNWYAQFNKMNKTPEIGFEYTLEPYMAYYQSHEHKICINLAKVTLSSIFEMAKSVASKIPLKNNPLVSVSYCSSGILNHELEHARRGQACGRNAHAHLEIEGQDFDFEACAAHFAKKAYAEGLFVQWAEAIQGLALPDSEQLAKLIEIESTCLDLLSQFV